MHSNGQEVAALHITHTTLQKGVKLREKYTKIKSIPISSYCINKYEADIVLFILIKQWIPITFS